LTAGRLMLIIILLKLFQKFQLAAIINTDN
jgi:hypothetical protein